MDKRYNFAHIEAIFKQYLLAGKSNLLIDIVSKPLHKVTVKNYLSDIRHFWNWYILYLNSTLGDDATELIRRLSPEAILSYRSYLEESAIPRKTINRRLSTLRKFGRFCLENGWLASNPAKEINNLIEFNETSLGSKAKKSVKKYISTPIINRLAHFEDGEKAKIYALLHRYKRFGLAACAVIACLLIFLLVRFSSLNRPSSALTRQPPEASRTLSFEGKLIDRFGTIITSPTKVQFRIYKNTRSDDYIYSSGVCSISPNEVGSFKIIIGKTCGPRIANSAFTDNQHLYLGIRVGSDPEMTPRQEITNIGFAENSNTLQGLPVGTKPGSIPYISDTGSLLITGSSPSIRSDSNNFTIQADTLTLQTSSEVGGDINFSPAAGGNVNITSGDLSVGENFRVNATGSLLKINQVNYFWPSIQGVNESVLTNDGLGNLRWAPNTISGWKDDGTTVKLASSLDNVSIGTASSSAKLTVSGTSNQKQLLIRSNTIQTTPIIEVQNASGTSLFNIDPTGAITTNADMFINASNLSSNATSFNLLNSSVTSLNIGGAATSLNLGAVTGLTTIRNNLTVNSNLGVGTTSPGAKLEVVGGQTKIEVSQSYTQRLCHSGIDSTAVQHVFLGDCSGGGSDLAEYYGSSDRTIEAGDVVVASSNAQMIGKDSKAYVEKSTTQAQNSMIGIVSTNPYDSFGKNFEAYEYTFPVALSGRVPVKIDPASGPIKTGDFLTSSAIAGRAVKATRPGVVIGKALESWSPSSDPEHRPPDKILVFISISWADPQLYFSQNGSINVPPQNTETYQGVSSRKEDFAEIAVEKLTATFVHAKTILAQTITADTITSAKKITSPRIETGTLVATESAEIPTIKTSTIKSHEENITVDLSDSKEKGKFAKLIIKGFEDKPAVSFDSAGNATLSGTLTASSIQSDKITARDIESETTNSLKERLSQLSNQTTEEQNSLTRKLVNSQTNINDIQKILGDLKNQPLASSEATLTLSDNENVNLTNLAVSGNANMYEAFVNKSLGVGNIVIQNDSIGSLTGELRLMALSQISFFNAKVAITQDGSITTEGKIIAKGGLELRNSKLEIRNSEGAEAASVDASGSARFANITTGNIAIQNKYLEATTEATLINTLSSPAIQTNAESAGIGHIPQGAPEVILYNTIIKKDSLIYITPTTSISNGQLSVVEKKSCEDQDLSICKAYFKVSTGNLNPTEIKFNWLIIN